MPEDPQPRVPGSKVERIKFHSQYLHGNLAQELASPASRFSDEQGHLLKFHGSYQQDDRDVRQERKSTESDRDWQFMVRCRIPGGRLTAAQYLAVDTLATRYANGTLRVTTRQGLQLHGVVKRTLRTVIADINQALVTTLAACGDVARNVMACPADETAYRMAADIAERLVPHTSAYHDIWLNGDRVQTGATDEEPLYGRTYLPRKFKIAVASATDNCVDVYTEDVGLVPDESGYTVLVGGGMGMTHGKPHTYPRAATALCHVATDQAVGLVEAIVTVFRDYGDRQNRKHARLKYLVQENGIDWLRDLVSERVGYRLEAPHSLSWGTVHDHLGWHRQPDGRWRIGLSVDSGRVQGRAAQGLRQVIGQFAPGVRLTPQQNLLLTDIDSARRTEVDRLLTEHGLITSPGDLGLFRYALACPALPTCGQAVAEAERVLGVVLSQVESELAVAGLTGEPVSVRITGCPNGCARPYMGDIGIVGVSKDLYHVYVGGDAAGTRLNTLYAPNVELSDIGLALRPLFADWRSGRQAQEPCGDFFHRVGQRQVAEVS